MARGWGGAPTRAQTTDLEHHIRTFSGFKRGALQSALRAALERVRDGTREEVEGHVFDAFYSVYGRYDPSVVVPRLVCDLLGLVRGWGRVATGGEVLRLQMDAMEWRERVGLRAPAVLSEM